MFDDFDMTAQCEECNWIFYALCCEEIIGDLLDYIDEEETSDELFCI